MTDNKSPSKVVWREPEDAGVVIGWFLLAMPPHGVGGWIVLGQYNTEDDEYQECVWGTRDWDKFLQDEVVRLAEVKGLGSGTMLIVASEKCLLEAQEVENG